MTTILIQMSPWYHRRCIDAVQQTIAQQTGLVVSIDDYQVVSPSHTLLKQIKLTDPETGQEVATVRQVDWSTEDGRTVILLQQPELQAETLSQSWSLLHDRFLCRPEHLGESARLAANDLTIHSLHSPITLRDVDAWIEPDGDSEVGHQSVRATIHCLLAGSAESSPIQITLLRDRSEAKPTTEWAIATGGTALPCSAIAEYLPGHWSNLGNNATFTGTMEGVADGADWQINLSGATLSNLSLDRIFQHQAHRFSGTATLKLQRCHLHPSQKTVDVSGSIHAVDGLIGRSLLQSTNQFLGFAINQLPPGHEDVAYDCMAMRFSLNGPRMRLDGICRQEIGYKDAPIGVVMGVGGIPIAQTPSLDLQAVRLMSVLAPSHSEMVPVSQQNQALLNLLIPPKRPIPDMSDRPPAPARISGVGQYQGGPLTGERR
ncbi:hypothetical protein [Rubripirellula obstinata]|uniref:hypothetical protein n=1 Tax=Rubripirellula obstinata TaxID=406547 RepID=UPI0013598773|nr:hypothetical protein [Rubripirellula obstinata]